MNAPLPRSWDSLRQSRGRRLERAASLGFGREIPVDRIIDLLEAVIQPGALRAAERKVEAVCQAALEKVHMARESQD